MRRWVPSRGSWLAPHVSAELSQIECPEKFRRSFDLISTHLPAKSASRAGYADGVHGLPLTLQNPGRLCREAQLDVVKRARAQDLSNRRPNQRAFCRVLRVQEPDGISPLVGHEIVDVGDFPADISNHSASCRDSISKPPPTR